MELQYCTITGADNETDPARLAETSVRRPFVEWGISYNPTNDIIPRRPTQEWVRRFLDKCPHVNKAIHLSNYHYDHGDVQAVSDFANGNEAIFRAIADFDRVQLNFFHLPQETVDRLAEPLREQVGRVIKEFPNKQFILQDNERSRNLIPLFDDLPSENIAYLFDSSGGQGRDTDHWRAPYPDRLCGYAGGWGPANIVRKIESLLKTAPQRCKIWADLETNVRTKDNQLDLDHYVVCVLDYIHRMACGSQRDASPRLQVRQVPQKLEAA
jgi:hypothetical protein